MAGKVAVFTFDTTNVMPATARELSEKYPMFRHLIFLKCFSHVGNLFLSDQLSIPSFADLLGHAKQIPTIFRTGSFRKLFLACVPLLLHPCANNDAFTEPLTADCGMCWSHDHCECMLRLVYLATNCLQACRLPQGAAADLYENKVCFILDPHQIPSAPPRRAGGCCVLV